MSIIEREGKERSRISKKAGFRGVYNVIVREREQKRKKRTYRRDDQ